METSPRVESRVPSRALRTAFGEAAVVAGTLAIFVLLLAPTLDNPLLERHDFRQTQTAFTARIFHKEGVDLLHPRGPVLGEPFEIPFELPLYQAAASLVMDLGVADDTAMRATTLLCFLATALLLYGLVRYVAGRTAALGSLAAFVLTPLAVVWSRASTIEYLATAGAVGFAWAFVVWRDRRQPSVGVLCLLAGLVGVLVKPTTAIFWLIPALAYRPTGPNRVGLRRDPWSMALLVVPLVAATAWTLHADAIKEATATTRFLTSSALRKWNFGTVDQRLDSAVWHQIGGVYAELLVGPVGLVLLVATALGIRRAEQRLFWIGVAATAFVPPIVFTNLYFIHEYYAAAVAPGLAALIGLGVARTASAIRRPRTRIAAAVVGAVLFSVWFVAGYTYWHSAYRGDAAHEALVLGLADELDRVTSPSDLVAVNGLDWNPAVLYYARRRGHMVPPRHESFAYDLIRAGPYAHLLVYEPGETDLGFMTRWRSIGALGAHTYAIGDEARTVARAPFLTTGRGAALNAHLARAASIGSPGTIDCARPAPIPAGMQGTWLELRDPPPSARVTVPSLAPLPARRLVFVAPELVERGAFTVACSGVERLSITRAWDAGPIG
jgi:hypothetical protein